ncbi:hypothetical protein JL720_14778 [Aureococcus anophagefferens]|nr:hypothetical protein JL720_14778 [Aureococcus anophagefferens]
MSGELGTDDVTEFVDRTLRAACNTPYQKCQRLNDVSTFPRDEYADGDDEFQHKSWAIGCDFAEKYPDLPEGRPKAPATRHRRRPKARARAPPRAR